MKRLILILTILAFFIFPAVGQRRRRNQLRIIQLPEAQVTGKVSLEQVLALRRSVRNFTDQTLNYSQLSQLCWAGQGITGQEMGFRTAPSAGAIYPMVLYLTTKDGVFVYEPQTHSLKQQIGNDVRKGLSKAAMGQESVAQAGCNIVIAGAVKRVSARYGRKARDFALLEAGHIAQNILLEAVSLELGAVPIGAFEISSVRKVCRMAGGLEPYYIISIGHPVTSIEKAEPVREDKLMPDEPKQKQLSAVLIIASNKFRDEELFETKQALQDAQITTTIACSRLGPVKGMMGGRAEPDIVLRQVKVDDYDAVIFIGGSGAKEYFDDALAMSIAQEAKDKNKVLAAICIAPAILANAGLLDGVKATSYSSERVALTKAGAEFTGADVEQDGMIITGSGPQAATKFGQAIAKTVLEQDESK